MLLMRHLQFISSQHRSRGKSLKANFYIKGESYAGN